MNKKIQMLFAFLLVPALMFAASTGKIRGKVTDEKTKEALIGANVVLVGTNYGAATDIDGNFIILNVPPGKYAVRASLLGYQNVVVNNVGVNEDLTSEVNFKLASSDVQLKEVVIVQERPLVNKSATNAVRIGTQEDIAKLPVRGVQAAIALSPGVVQQNGKIFIRGGRADEVGYYLEGANARNIIADANTGTNQNLATVIPEALEEFQVQAGGYTAEYGGANAGIIRQTLRTGTSNYKGTFQVETDNFTQQNEKRFGTYSYGYSNYVATLSGPVYFDNIKFFIAGENEFQRDTQVRFWDGITMDSKPDISTKRDSVPAIDLKPGNIPGGMKNRYTLNSTLTFDYNPFVIRVGGSFSKETSHETADPLRLYFNMARLPITDLSNLLLNTKFTHILSSSTLYEVNVNYTDYRRKVSDPILKDNFLIYNDSIANAKYGYVFKNYTTDPGSGSEGYNLYSFRLDRFGAVRTTFTKEKQARWGGTIDFTSQVNTNHQLKVGASGEYNVARYFQTGSRSLLLYYLQYPDIIRTGGKVKDFGVARQGGVNNYGYDFYGNEITDANNIDGPKTPINIGAYIQDKMEFSDLVVNAGVRLDYIDNDDIEFKDDPTTPQIDGLHNPSVDITDTGFPVYVATGIKKAKPFTGVSPRLGFSFPVTDRTVFHMQYGKFIQAPSLNIAYAGRGVQAGIWSGQNYYPNPRGYNLQPTRTTQYEVGFSQQFSDFAAFDIVGFYKDIEGQIQIAKIVTDPGANTKGYNAFVNGDFVTTKGVELSLRLRRINHFRVQFNYTFSDGQGTGSSTNSAVSSVENGTLTPNIISPLDFNQTHRGSANIDFSFDKGEGGLIFESFGANLLFTFNSGHPYTKSTGSIGQQSSDQGALIEADARFNSPLESVNGSVTPWNYNFDVRLYKGFSIGGVTAEAYMYVQNLLNARNVINVYRRTGNSYDDGFLSNDELSNGAKGIYGQDYVNLYTQANLNNGRAYRNVTGNNLWGTPRQIRFGVRLEI